MTRCAGGELGKLLGVTVTWALLKPAAYYEGALSWRKEKGGGPILINLIHEIDNLRYICGEIDEVYAIGTVLVAPDLAKVGDVDTTIVTLHFANGALGVIDNSRQAVYGYDQRLEVFCAHGTAQADNESADTVVTGTKDGYQAGRLPYFFMHRYAACYVDEVREFIACVREDQPTPTSGQDGRLAVVLGLAAWKSCRENRPVKLSEIG